MMISLINMNPISMGWAGKAGMDELTIGAIKIAINNDTIKRTRAGTKLSPMPGASIINAPTRAKTKPITQIVCGISSIVVTSA